MVVGCAVAIGVDPLVAVLSVPLAISGVWTGNLQIGAPGDSTPVLSARRQRDDLTRHWYRWVIGAVALGAAGFVPLIVGDVFGVADECTETNPCASGSVLWATWIVSWFLGMVSAGVGVILGVLRVIVTRPRR